MMKTCFSWQQVMCLEEMLCCDIQKASLYYGEIRRRYPVEITEELKEKKYGKLRPRCIGTISGGIPQKYEDQRAAMHVH